MILVRFSWRKSNHSRHEVHRRCGTHATQNTYYLVIVDWIAHSQKRPHPERMWPLILRFVLLQNLYQL